MKKLIVASVLTALMTAPALAGNAKLKSDDGTKLRINCQNSGCKVTAKKPGAKKWGLVERTKGGRDNYLLLEKKYKGMGYH